MWPVSKAVHTWCAADDRCDFGIMVGDNIYPSGGFVEVKVAGDSATVDVITTPASGSGEPVHEYSR
jgi:hypothetical protein